ncbi:glycosyltransferase family 2 protein [candidate division KSB1 bacterium]|nr:glycosyltransferase family 2 protein [candidate division KSB1 bacterium]
MNIGILIPAYNAEKYIKSVIAKTQAITSYRIVVVDDGSTDHTAEQCKSIGIDVLSHSTNKGKGEALKSGFIYMMQHEFDAVITLDADGQHDPQFIPAFIQAAQADQYDIVIGSRMTDLKDMPFHRRLSNKITSLLISLRIGQRVEDSQCGYRFIKMDVLRRIALKTHFFETESEILLKSGLMNFRIGHVPIHTIYAGESTAMKLVIDTLRFIRLYLSSFFW